jgi:hypothetical protein
MVEIVPMVLSRNTALGTDQKRGGYYKLSEVGFAPSDECRRRSVDDKAK